MAYFESEALKQLTKEVNALYPNRDKSSDGWIGDASHQARPSDHNPDWTNGGIVRAHDYDEDFVAGLTAVGEAMPFVNAIITDPRVAYVIYEGRIWQNPAVFKRGGWLPYSGVNAHRHHVHVSIRRGAQWDRDGKSWNLATKVLGKPDYSPPANPVKTESQEDEMPDLIYRATSSEGPIFSGWSYLQAHDGSLRALSALEYEARQYAYRQATGKDLPVVQWAGKDLANLAIANGLWEFTGTIQTGPQGLTGRLIGRNAPYDPGSTYGTDKRAFPPVRVP